MSVSFARASRQASSTPKDFDFQFFVYQSESDHPFWWSSRRVLNWLHALPDNTVWNCITCLCSFLATLVVAMDLRSVYPVHLNVLDIIYNVMYAVNAVGIVYSECYSRETIPITWSKKVAYVIDVLSYLHYSALLLPRHISRVVKLVCYYFRLYRPFKYLWALNDYNLKGSVVGTALKFTYIFLVMRLTFALMWLEIDKRGSKQLTPLATSGGWAVGADVRLMLGLGEDLPSTFFRALYIVNKMFMPIGPLQAPTNDMERIACLVIMLSGCLMVTGIAIASLALVISLYMRSEELYRERFRLIMKDMRNSHVPNELIEKVETFYRMYWLKQKGVSVSELLPTFPPTLPATVYADIYFEAQQKSFILRDLSYQFLTEVAKSMHTIHFIPGDSIIQQGSSKSSIIYITYGDVEMLTAEDDVTPILRMTRGTILSQCGGTPEAGCAPAYVNIQAATYCTAHVLKASDLWKVTLKHGKSNGQEFIITSSFLGHLERVKKHYASRAPQPVKYKSSILHFKRNIMALKEAKDSDGKLLLNRTDFFLEIAGCYIMRNRTDASLSDESDAICLRPTFPCILQPTSSLQTIWKTFMAFLTFIVCFTYPYNLIYLKDVSPEFKFFDLGVTCIFILDIFIFLSTGANVEEGVPITFAQTSSEQMKNSWFALDVLATLPFFEFVGTGHFGGINKLLRLPKAFRTLKEMENVCVYHSNVLRFLSYTILMVIACYLIATLQQGVMCYQFGYCRVSNYTHSPFWAQLPLIDTAEAIEGRISFGLYWAISFSTFTAHKTAAWGLDNWYNVIYTVILMEACIVLHVFIEAVYSATIMVTSTMREEYDSSIENVKNFLIRNNVDPLLRHRFITYLQLCWYTDKAYSMTHKKISILHDLPIHVYQDLVASQRSKYILGIPFMKFLHMEDLKLVSSKARLFFTSPNEILLETGDMCNEMYVIKRGICELLDPQTKKVVKLLTVKEHFGVLECMLRLPTYYTVRAATHVEVFSISRKYLINATKVPQIERSIEFAKLQPEYKKLLHRYEPFVFYEIPPPSPNREQFKLPRKHEPDFAFLNPFVTLGPFSIFRYIFPRYTIRPDGQYLFRYEWFRALCALLSSLVFPSYTYLVLQWPWLHYVAVLLDLSAYFDMIQRTLVAYFNEDGILVFHPASTAAHYLNGAFVVDLLACLPLEYIDAARKVYSGGALEINPTSQYMMLNRLLQLYRVPGAMDILIIYIERRDILLIIKAIPLFMALINVIVCFMIFESVHIYQPLSGAERWKIVPREADSWLTLYKGKAFRFGMIQTPWNLHLAVYFWVVYETTTTGYNVFNPTNLGLMQVLFVGKMVALMVTTYFAVSVISIRSNVNKPLATFQENMKDITAYMKRERLPEELRKEVLSYYTHNWDKMGGTDYRSVLKLCDQITLRTDAILHIYGRTFSKCPILFRCDLSLLRIIGRAVHSVYFQTDMQIITKDDVIEEMYFVDYGSCIVYEDDIEIDEYADMIPTTRLPRGSVFGNLDGSTLRCPTTVVAVKNVHLLQINSRIFHSIIVDFPNVKVLMNKLRAYGETYITGSLAETSSMTGKSWKAHSHGSPLVVATTGLPKYINNKSQIFMAYLIFVSMASMYADVFNAGFTDNSLVVIVLLYTLDVLFSLKILLNYILPYSFEEHELRKSLLRIRQRYIHTEFKYDVASCLPIELFCFLQEPDSRWAAFSLLRLNRMFRMVTVYNCLQRHLERLNINLVLSTITTVFIWFTLFVHCTTCLWYYIGMWEESQIAHSSWIYDSAGASMCSGMYTCSLYFILTTLTQNGVGDILPRKQSEVLFVSLLEIISTMIYMIYVGEFSNIIQYQSFRSFSYYRKYLQLREYLKNNHVSRNLVNLVMKYCIHLWRETRGLQIPYFLENAPRCLKLNIMSAAYMYHFTKHPTFQKCEPAFLRQLAGCLKLYIYNEDLFVVKENEITDSMFFVHTGRIQELADDLEEKTQVFGPGQYFGTLQGLNRDTPYTYTYHAIINSQVLTLHLDDWEPLLEHFPISKMVIYEAHGSTEDDKGGKEEKRRTRMRFAEHHEIMKSKIRPPTSLERGPSRDGPPPIQSFKGPMASRRYNSLKVLSQPRLQTEDLLLSQPPDVPLPLQPTAAPQPLLSQVSPRLTSTEELLLSQSTNQPSTQLPTTVRLSPPMTDDLLLSQPADGSSTMLATSSLPTPLKDSSSLSGLQSPQPEQSPPTEDEPQLYSLRAAPPLLLSEDEPQVFQPTITSPFLPADKAQSSPLADGPPLPLLTGGLSLSPTTTSPPFFSQTSGSQPLSPTDSSLPPPSIESPQPLPHAEDLQPQEITPRIQPSQPKNNLLDDDSSPPESSPHHAGNKRGESSPSVAKNSSKSTKFVEHLSVPSQPVDVFERPSTTEKKQILTPEQFTLLKPPLSPKIMAPYPLKGLATTKLVLVPSSPTTSYSIPTALSMLAPSSVHVIPKKTPSSSVTRLSQPAPADIDSMKKEISKKSTPESSTPEIRTTKLKSLTSYLPTTVSMTDLPKRESVRTLTASLMQYSVENRPSEQTLSSEPKPSKTLLTSKIIMPSKFMEPSTSAKYSEYYSGKTEEKAMTEISKWHSHEAPLLHEERESINGRSVVQKELTQFKSETELSKTTKESLNEVMIPMGSEGLKLMASAADLMQVKKTASIYSLKLGSFVSSTTSFDKSKKRTGNDSSKALLNLELPSNLTLLSPSQVEQRSSLYDSDEECEISRHPSLFERMKASAKRMIQRTFSRNIQSAEERKESMLLVEAEGATAPLLNIEDETMNRSRLSSSHIIIHEHTGELSARSLRDLAAKVDEQKSEFGASLQMALIKEFEEKGTSQDKQSIHYDDKATTSADNRFEDTKVCELNEVAEKLWNLEDDQDQSGSSSSTGTNKQPKLQT